MTPGNIVGMAAVTGLDVIAVTDHNSCRNCPAVMKFAQEYGEVLSTNHCQLTLTLAIRNALFTSFSYRIAKVKGLPR